MIDLDDIKVLGAGGAGIGSWYLPVRQLLQVSISVATLVFICLKIRQLIVQRGKTN